MHGTMSALGHKRTLRRQFLLRCVPDDHVSMIYRQPAPARFSEERVVTHLSRMAFAVGRAPAAMPADWWSSRSVRQQAEPPLRRKAVSGVSTTV